MEVIHFFFSSDGRHGSQPRDTEIEIIIQVKWNASFHCSTALDAKIRPLFIPELGKDDL